MRTKAPLAVRLAKKKAIDAAYYRANRAMVLERVKAYCRARRLENPNGARAKNNEVNRRWRKENPEKCRQSFRKWCRTHPAEVNAFSRARQALKSKALPSWADRKTLVRFYTEAKRKTQETGVKHEVDHVWPLRGVGFCGLHVSWNLQVITKIQNLRKGNRRPRSL